MPLMFTGFFALAQQSTHVLQPNFLGNKSYTEIYTLDLFSEDSTFVQVQFTFTNLGVESRNAACKALVLHESKKPWKVNEKFTEKQWKYADTPNPVISIGSNEISALGDKTVLRSVVGGGRIDVTLFAAVAPRKPPDIDYPATASGALYGYELLTPWSRAQATLVLPGRPPLKLSGFGNLDRARSVGTSRDICRGWVTFRGCKEPCFFLLDLRLPPQKNAPATGWAWRTGDQKPLPMRGIEVKNESSVIDGNEISRPMVIAGDRSFTITGTQPLYRYSFVDELGMFTGSLVKMVIGKPITTYYQATAQFADGTPSVPGILELMSIE